MGHVASIGAGAFVKQASFLGIAKGVRPGWRRARIRRCTRSVCSPGHECDDVDKMAAIDYAIDDVISVSIGRLSIPFYGDHMATATFSAFEGGVIACCAAGNDGPKYKSLSDEAPWILTVAASTTDRGFASTVKHGNGLEFDGQTIFPADEFPASNAAFWSTPVKTACKAVETGRKGWLQHYAGSRRDPDVKRRIFRRNQDPVLHPFNLVPNYDVGLQRHGDTRRGPRPSLPTPREGPATKAPGFLSQTSPAPGDNILGASYQTLMSGTSMSTPHVCGIAALIRKAHGSGPVGGSSEVCDHDDSRRGGPQRPRSRSSMKLAVLRAISRWSPAMSILGKHWIPG
ncbi:subtilisin-like protease 4 [Typha latifolia]|uniref:subtilisin-like protease 4 n=1 Tax=Typha latifolia TaxID=4733 RepID=UPI003C2D21D1